MKRNLSELKSRRFDVLVLGGGITGAWIALDCAARGLDVAVIDKGDFGSATSAKSTKVIHGGIRYLQQLRVDKVRESAVERAYYHRAAPHLTQFLPFMVPTYGHGMKGKAFMQAGMTLYKLLSHGEDRLAGDPSKVMPAPYFMTRAQVLEHCPIGDPRLTGALVYYESHMQSSERMTLAVLDTAHNSGAVCANYVRAEGFTIDHAGTVTGAIVRDVDADDSFEIGAALIVNAAGPWIPSLNRTLSGADAVVTSTGFSQGSHLVTRQLVEKLAIALPTRFAGQNVVDRGGRHIFILPWRGCSLIGTSYVPARNGIDDPVIQQEEIDQLLNEVNRQMPGINLSQGDIRHTFSGIYPLNVGEIRETTYQGTGDYQIVDHEAAGHKGLISALGAKFTTARLVAEKVTRLVESKLGKALSPCETRDMALSSAGYSDLGRYRTQIRQRLGKQADNSQADRLVEQYGSGVEAFVDRIEADAGLAESLCDSRPNLVGEVVHAVESEMAITLEDVIYRRTGLGTIGYPGWNCVERCADIMAQLCGWGHDKKVREMESLDRNLLSEASVSCTPSQILTHSE
jgi:glycerol-3-phosphate dehydrogenase